MTDHSPAVIAAAKALAEKHGFDADGYVHPRFVEAFCEALSTTLPSEEAMSTISAQEMRDNLIAKIKAAPNPEPTEDHYRKSCSALGIDYGRFIACEIVEAWDNAVRTVARLLAERDAMQARVDNVSRSMKRSITQAQIPGNDWRRELKLLEGCVASLSAEPTPDPDLVLAREAAADHFACCKEDIDGFRLGHFDNDKSVQSALRALKLAKEQGK